MAVDVRDENRTALLASKRNGNVERLPVQQPTTKRAALTTLQSGHAPSRRTTKQEPAKQPPITRRTRHGASTTEAAPPPAATAAFTVYEDGTDKENCTTETTRYKVRSSRERRASPFHAPPAREPLQEIAAAAASPEAVMECDAAESPMILDVSLPPAVSDVPSCYSEEREAAVGMEYAQEIYNYLREQENKLMPKANYMSKQPDITTSMRTILVDWLVEVAEEYKLHSETLFLAVSYVDRFLSAMSVVRSKLQLVGTAALYVASKFEEIYPPEVSEFVYITDDTYTKKQVLRMEHLVLKVLAFDLAAPTPYYFLLRFASISRAPDTVRHLAQYLCELSLLEEDPYLQYPPSIIAGAALCLANHTLNCCPWTEDLAHHSGYEVSDFRECIHCLYSTFSNASTMQQQAAQEKFRSSKFHCVSNIRPSPTLPF